MAAFPVRPSPGGGQSLPLSVVIEGLNANPADKNYVNLD